ncbi:MAG: polysaccharide deacetylase family protein [Mucilaginibacter sp.]|uniref:polysaccharide deacetylase family protein n=1 Tax=Mucilaginibacter sp. TaxID=1882438 RepID=UPI0032653E28
MDVYLSFDDGIQSGTKQVLETLKANSVKATFFLTGSFSNHYISQDETNFLCCLKDIYENHSIGNHSFSHANEFYSDYYHKGLKIDNSDLRRSVTDDFKLNKNWINTYLARIFGEKKINESTLLAANQVIQLGRLPGRNAWRINPAIFNSNQANFLISIDDVDTKQEADMLFQDGYQIFGWHEEWKMKFELSSDTRSFFKQNIETIVGEYNSPNWDLHSMENFKKDRLTEDYQDLIDRMMTKRNSEKLIILMHDRAFRTGYKKNNTNISPEISIKYFDNEREKLSKMINTLKQYNARFKTLDKFY